LTVAVIAVDPTSPFTGGALLGDRIRMTKHALDEGVFIRSMGSRGNRGGLSRSTREAIAILDAAKYDVIFVETVGVGQNELEIMYLVDSIMLVLNPESGDMIQVCKAGMMEIADLYIVNKADLTGANRLQRDLEEMLNLAKGSNFWRPPVIQTTTIKNNGIKECWQQLLQHRGFLKQSGKWAERRKQNMRQAVHDMIEEALRQRIERELSQPEFHNDLEQIYSKNVNLYHIAQKWLFRLIKT
jgi:LAO/AO transport system kinase